MPTRTPSNQSTPPPIHADTNWTRLGIVAMANAGVVALYSRTSVDVLMGGIAGMAIVGVVAVVGMMNPTKGGVEYDNGRFKADFERHPTEDQATPPKPQAGRRQ